MAHHQYAVFAEGTRAHHHLELRVHPDAGTDAVRAALGAVRVVADQHRANGGFNLVIGVGPGLWRRLAGDRTPAGLRDFPGYHNEVADRHAPATQADLWIWLHGPSPSELVDALRAVGRTLEPVADVTLDLPAFVYKDSRDLTGFIDGTANPLLGEAPDIALVPDGEPGAGGVFAMTMRFVHDLDAFGALAVADQERVFGRTRPDSVQLRGDAKPADAHISRAEVADDEGEELKVYRRSVPWATLAEQGLHFVSFGRDLDRFDLQLRHMYGLVDDGVVDHLLSFTRALTGSFWFCPSVEDLDAAAPLPADTGDD